VVRRLEPRITNFEVQLLDNTEPLDRTLRFRIVGQVLLGDERQEMHFDSHVDPVKAGVVIRE
jgi:type VI secretion system protein ImpF